MKFTKIFLFTLSLCLAGCEMREVEELPEENAGEATTRYASQTDKIGSAIQARIEAQSEPGHYRVELTWKPEAVALWLMRRRATGPYEKIELASAGSGRAIDPQVVSGERYGYALFTLDKEQRAKDKLSEVEVKVPRDVVIRGASAVKEIRATERLFLEKGAVVTGVDGILKIDVKELHSDGALLQTRPKEMKEASPAAGLIQLRAERAFGHLTVVGRGTDGPQGADGATGIAGASGATGADGTLSPKGVPPALVGQYMEGFRKQDTSKLTPEQWKAMFECKTAPQNGGRGQSGGKGGAGGKGFAGGPAAKIWVRVEYPDEFQLTHEVLPGRGGRGGKAGKGGLGGAGGEPGKDFHVCPRAKAGDPGAKGEDGLPGEEGPKGNSVEPCVWLGPTKVGECDPPTLSID